MFTYYIVIRVSLAIVLMRGSLELDGMWVAILVSHIVALFIAFVIERKERIER